MENEEIDGAIERIRNICKDSFDIDEVRKKINTDEAFNQLLTEHRLLTGAPTKNGKAEFTLKSRGDGKSKKFFVHLKHIRVEYVSRLK
jgi:hypothetical protein